MFSGYVYVVFIKDGEPRRIRAKSLKAAMQKAEKAYPNSEIIKIQKVIT